MLVIAIWEEYLPDAIKSAKVLGKYIAISSHDKGVYVTETELAVSHENLWEALWDVYVGRSGVYKENT